MSTVFVRLPRDPQPERAGALVRDAGRALRGLNSLIVNEHLTSGPPYEPLLTQFVYVAPDRFSYRTSGSGDAVVIGARRWDRQGPKSPWVLSIQEPSRVPAPDWRRVAHPSVLGSGRTAGRPVWRVSFYDPSVPAWFEADLDRATGLPLELWMVAAAHFMRHVYGAFNAPLVVLPPTASTATG
jgi:hypothetical protein